MPVTINGDGSITGLSVGGLPNGTVDADTLASNAVTTAKIANDAVTADKASGTAKGLTMVDHWRKDSQVTGNQSPITGWERVDTHFSLQGSTGMTESSGVFTFPSTGIYKISFFGTWLDQSANNDYLGQKIQYSTDSGSNYSDGTVGWVSAQTNDYASQTVSFFFDVTNVSTHRVRFLAQSQGNGGAFIFGSNSTSDLNFFEFIRLGDT